MNKYKVKRERKPQSSAVVARAVEEVDSWDGAASNYEDTEAYCAACLIDVNEAAGNEEKKQSHCMLPVKQPGSSAMADKAIMAAAGGRGITAVKKPSDVDQAAWDKAVTKAAKTLVTAYGQMDREPPDSVVELAGGKSQRSVMFDQAAQQIQDWSYAEPGRPWISSFYLEKGALYGLFNDRGMLYRGKIDLDSDGQTVTIGTLEEVKHEFVPVVRSVTPASFVTIREADNRIRFFMTAGTAIVNRVGEIDSTKLYDDMIRRAEESGFYPTLDFWHLGELDRSFEFGQFDFLARDGAVYLGSGLLYENHPLAEAAVTATRENPDYWGASIEYVRPATRGYEIIVLGDWEIPVYTEGLNTRISLLPEYAAASWFTSYSVEERNVDPKKLEALKKLFGNNEQAFRDYLASIEGVNKEVRDKNLVTRSTEAAGTEEAVGTEPEGTPESEESTEEEQPVVELDQETVEAIVEVARSRMAAELQGLQEAITGFTAQVSAILAEQKTIADRLSAVEATDEEKQRSWINDLPSHKVKPVSVRFRPREQAATNGQPETVTAAAQASTVLSKLPKVGAF